MHPDDVLVRRRHFPGKRPRNAGVPTIIEAHGDRLVTRLALVWRRGKPELGTLTVFRDGAEPLPVVTGLAAHFHGPTRVLDDHDVLGVQMLDQVGQAYQANDEHDHGHYAHDKAQRVESFAGRGGTRSKRGSHVISPFQKCHYLASFRAHPHPLKVKKNCCTVPFASESARYADL